MRAELLLACVNAAAFQRRRYRARTFEHRSSAASRWFCPLTPVCVCVMPSVGPGIRWPAHPSPVQHSTGQVQEAAGAWEDPAHSVHRKPLHQGELRLPEDPCRRRPHRPRRLRWGPPPFLHNNQTNLHRCWLNLWFPPSLCFPLRT